jgi:hypothetical protein
VLISGQHPFSRNLPGLDRALYLYLYGFSVIYDLVLRTSSWKALYVLISVFWWDVVAGHSGSERARNRISDLRRPWNFATVTLIALSGNSSPSRTKKHPSRLDRYMTLSAPYTRYECTISGLQADLESIES